MDFRFGEPEEKLRAEVRGFLQGALPPVETRFHPDVPGGDDFEEALAFNKKLAARGWIAPAWPKEYGGLGATHIEQAIFAEELGYHRAPHGQRIFGIGMTGPTLFSHGSEEHKREHLPGITSASVNWC